MEWLRPILAGLAGAVVVAALVALAGRPVPARAGWRRVTPSAMHWIGIVLGGGLALLMTWVRLFVGSSRADAESQMTILTWLIVAFALCTIVTAWSVVTIRRQAVRWRGARLVYGRGGREREADLDTLTRIGRDALGRATLSFADGTMLRIDPNARGARELIEAAEERPSVAGG